MMLRRGRLTYRWQGTTLLPQLLDSLLRDAEDEGEPPPLPHSPSFFFLPHQQRPGMVGAPRSRLTPFPPPAAPWLAAHGRKRVASPFEGHLPGSCWVLTRRFVQQLMLQVGHTGVHACMHRPADASRIPQSRASSKWDAPPPPRCLARVLSRATQRGQQRPPNIHPPVCSTQLPRPACRAQACRPPAPHAAAPPPWPRAAGPPPAVPGHPVQPAGAVPERCSCRAAGLQQPGRGRGRQPWSRRRRSSHGGAAVV